MNEDRDTDLNDEDFVSATRALTVNKLIHKTAKNLAMAEALTREVPLRTKYTKKLEEDNE